MHANVPKPHPAQDAAALQYQRAAEAPPLRVDIEGTIDASPVELQLLRSGKLRCAGGPDADRLQLTGWNLAVRSGAAPKGGDAPAPANGDDLTLQSRQPLLPRFRPYLARVGDSKPWFLPAEDGVTFLLGRGSSVDLPILDPHVSRQHARIVMRRGVAVVQDLGSMLGTQLDGRPLRTERALRHGDVLTIGDASFVYHSLAEDLRQAQRPEPVDEVARPQAPLRLPGRAADWDAWLTFGFVVFAAICIAWITALVAHS